MGNDAGRRAPTAPGATVRYGPPRATGPVIAVIAALAALAGTQTDAAGRLLLGVCVIGLATAAGWLIVGGDVVTADATGVTVRDGFHRHRLAWPEVRSIVVDDRRRSRALELDTDRGLLAVPAILLGRASPRQAAEQLRALRARPAADPTPRAQEERPSGAPPR